MRNHNSIYALNVVKHTLSKKLNIWASCSNLQIVDLVRNYNKEVKMREENVIPVSVEEHLQVSARTSACHLLACTSLVGMDDIATKASFEWVSTVPKIVQKLCIIVRLLDDIMTYEVININ